jgi:DNA invertase Pin-like site-specific DNA recombinase
MTKVAYSYMRFSNSQQANGDSRRRQLAMAEKYAAEHGLTLDRHLSFRDLGVSTFRGKNAKEGALRAFLEAIEHNLVPPHSYLLVESLDRLSRDPILAAQALFLQIIQAGITIVTLTDQRSYSLDSINQNPLDLIVSLVAMMRANEESEMKSRRIRAAFEIMRSKLHEKPWTARCPGWLHLNKEAGKFTIIEERVEIVRRIFRESLAGVGRETIARRLNEERIPLFGQGNQRGKLWQETLIRHLLYTPAVLGTLVPFISEWVDGVQRHREPLCPGEPKSEFGYASLLVALDAGHLSFRHHTRPPLRHQLHPPHQLRHETNPLPVSPEPTPTASVPPHDFECSRRRGSKRRSPRLFISLRDRARRQVPGEAIDTRPACLDRSQPRPGTLQYRDLLPGQRRCSDRHRNGHTAAGRSY